MPPSNLSSVTVQLVMWWPGCRGQWVHWQRLHGDNSQVYSPDAEDCSFQYTEYTSTFTFTVGFTAAGCSSGGERMVKILSVGSVLLHHRVTPSCWTLTRLEGVIRVSEQQWRGGGMEGWGVRWSPLDARWPQPWAGPRSAFSASPTN